MKLKLLLIFQTVGIVFQSQAQFPATIKLSDLDGSNGFAITGFEDIGFYGSPVGQAGDINGDGINDIIIGNQDADPDGKRDAGSAFVVFGSEQVFDDFLSIADLNGENGFAVHGNRSFDELGTAVGGIGDVNGDGFDDIIISAPLAGDLKPPLNTTDRNEGHAYIIYGKSTGFPSTFDLNNLNGQNGFTIKGFPYSTLGGVVSKLGDVNGVGVDDFIIGLKSETVSYVFYGRKTAFPSSFPVSDLNGQNGYILAIHSTVINDEFSLSEVGDINNDQLNDIIIGHERANTNQGKYTGSTYVVYGSQSVSSNILDLASLDGLNGFVIHGAFDRGGLGYSVSGAGDLNADGIDDMLFGAPFIDYGNNFNLGSAYVVYGNSTGFEDVLSINNLNGINGFTTKGVDVEGYLGGSVSVIGDINADGIDDMIIGAAGASSDDNYLSGKSYVVFGNQNGFDESLDLTVLNGDSGFLIEGDDDYINSGVSLDRLGDVNGDSFDDFLVGTRVLAIDSGEKARELSYVIFGTDVIFKNSFE